MKIKLIIIPLALFLIDSTGIHQQKNSTIEGLALHSSETDLMGNESELRARIFYIYSPSLNKDCSTNLDGLCERGAGKKRWFGLSRRHRSEIKRNKNLELFDIREKGEFVLRIEMDSSDVVRMYPEENKRPNYIHGNLGLKPYDREFGFSKRDGKNIWYMELSFLSLPSYDQSIQILSIEPRGGRDPVMSHVHGHICDPTDPLCPPT